jgi:DNA repair photolyase
MSVEGFAAMSSKSPYGRGSVSNPANRFELILREPIEGDPGTDLRVDTYVYRDSTRKIITSNDSPDVGFEFSINPYRGCEHGCAYCYARPFHEYLGFSAGLDFETRIMAKEEAPELLRKELTSPRWRPATISMSGVTDSYQPVERKLELTRRCLQVLAEFRNPVGIVTKNQLVTRDIDILQELAGHRAAAVLLSVTSLDPELARVLEPRATQPQGRLRAISELAGAGIPVGVMVAPVIPGLTDHEVPAIVQACAEAGARFAGFTALRLPGAVAGLFEQWLERHFPARKKKVLDRVRSMRGGKLNDARFHSRMKGQGTLAEQTRALFHLACRNAGLDRGFPDLSVADFCRPGNRQSELFD